MSAAQVLQAREALPVMHVLNRTNQIFARSYWWHVQFALYASLSLNILMSACFAASLALVRGGGTGCCAQRACARGRAVLAVVACSLRRVCRRLSHHVDTDVSGAVAAVRPGVPRRHGPGEHRGGGVLPGADGGAHVGQHVRTLVLPRGGQRLPAHAAAAAGAAGQVRTRARAPCGGDLAGRGLHLHESEALLVRARTIRAGLRGAPCGG